MPDGSANVGSKSGGIDIRTGQMASSKAMLKERTAVAYQWVVVRLGTMHGFSCHGLRNGHHDQLQQKN